MIKREYYLNNIRPFVNKNIIKIITGIRRSGKSTLLEQIIAELKSDGIKDDQIIHLKLDLFENKKLRNKDELFSYINNSLNETKKNYLFLDEIQEVADFEDLVLSFLDKDIDIYLTGSNSKMLSKELSTNLTGRYVSFEIFPFSFKEYCEYHKPENLDLAFLDFVNYGGLPQVQMFSDGDDKKRLLRDLYNSIIVKDLSVRYNIRNINQFENFVSYLSGIISKQFSAKNVSNYFNKDNRKISNESLYNYLNYTKEAFFIYSSQRYDIQGKKVLETNEKIFINDQGFRSLYFNNESDIEKVLENIVYLELRRRGYDIKVGYVGEYEIDFIAEKDSVKKYFQVSYLLANEKTIEREFRPLLQIKDQFPKYVISMDKVNLSREGVVHLNIIDWLLNVYKLDIDINQYYKIKWKRNNDQKNVFY